MPVIKTKRKSNQQKLIKSYLTIILSLFVLFLGIVSIDHSNTKFIYQEDGLIENLSAGICLGTFFLGIILTIKNLRPSKIIIASSFLSLLGFLDELSYGERIFKIKMPTLYSVKVDGIHDFLEVIKQFLKFEIFERPDRYLATILIAIIVLFAITWSLYTKYTNTFHSLLRPRSPQFTLFISFVMFLGISQFIDLNLFKLIKLDLLKNKYAITIEELFETFAWLSLLFSCLLANTKKIKSNII